jgi:hypothetical protein
MMTWWNPGSKNQNMQHKKMYQWHIPIKKINSWVCNIITHASLASNFRIHYMKYWIIHCHGWKGSHCTTLKWSAPFFVLMNAPAFNYSRDYKTHTVAYTADSCRKREYIIDYSQFFQIIGSDIAQNALLRCYWGQNSKILNLTVLDFLVSPRL